MRRPPAAVKDLYGAHPLHLLSLAVCFALAGYVAVQVLSVPRWPWMLAWFAGAVIAHDLVAFPLYALADRSLVRALRPSRAPRLVPAVNHIRLPAMGSALLFVLFFPLITRQVQRTYPAASGHAADAYLGHWLLITAAMFAASAVVYALRLGYALHRRHTREG